MKSFRILIFEERPSPGRELRLNLLGHAVEFDFRDPAKEDLETLDLFRYAAIVAPVESARTGIIGVLSDAKRYGGPLFLYRDEPPVHEVARWVIWGSPSHGGPDGPVADRLLAGKPRILLDGIHVPAMPRDDVHAGRGEAAGPDHGDVRPRPRGGELRHLARFALRPGRDADRFRAGRNRDRPGGVPLLPFADRYGRRGLEGSPVPHRDGGGKRACAADRAFSFRSFTRATRSAS